MGLFDSIFGRTRKINFGEVFRPPPRFNLAPGSVEGLTGGFEDLISTFQRRAAGKDQFDFIRFLFEPQLNRLNQAFGRDFIGGRGEAGALGRRRGALGQLEADLQRRGLLDAGVSGVLQAQLESDRAGREADLFGQAKILQREDIDSSLQSLANLFPARFQAQNIPSQVNFFNTMNEFLQNQNRNLATVQQQQFRDAQRGNLFQSGLNLALTPFTGGINLFGNRSSANRPGGFNDFFRAPQSAGVGFFRPTPPPPGFRGVF